MHEHGKIGAATESGPDRRAPGWLGWGAAFMWRLLSVLRTDRPQESWSVGGWRGGLGPTESGTGGGYQAVVGRGTWTDTYTVCH